MCEKSEKQFAGLTTPSQCQVQLFLEGQSFNLYHTPSRILLEILNYLMQTTNHLCSLRIPMTNPVGLNSNIFSIFNLILTLFCLSLSFWSVAGSIDKPNIIFIFTDDQRFDALGFLHPVLETPNIDRLAERGVYFPNAFVTTPICASSRATVLTGLHEQRHGFTFRTPPLNMKFLQKSYPKLLRDNGYTTGFVGKNGMSLDKDRIELLFDYYVPVSIKPYIQIRDGEEIHATDYTAKKAAEFIKNTANPFVLSVWFNAPHAEDSDPEQFIPPQRYNNLFSGIDFPDPPTSDPNFFSMQPEFLQDSLNRVRWAWRWTPQLYDSMMSGYLAMIKGVDDAIGEILEQTVTSGVADRTVVIFMSDNGYFIGERGFAGKWLAYEPSIRVPLLIYDPRLDSTQQGRILPQTALNIDLPETILDLAGVEIPHSMQGRSLVPLLNGDNPDWRNDFFIEHFFTFPPKVVIPPHESLRSTDLKYIHYTEQDYEELYNLNDDPYEQFNLANQPVYRAQLDIFRKRTIELKRLYSGFEMNAGLSDAWYNPDTNGQGFFITIFPDRGQVSLAWFTYDTEPPAVDVMAVLGDPGHRWLIALGEFSGNRAVMDVSYATGGLFDSTTPTTEVYDGTITLTFTGCNSGTVEYNIPSINQQGTVPIERIVGDNIALCEALISE